MTQLAQVTIILNKVSAKKKRSYSETCIYQPSNKNSLIKLELELFLPINSGGIVCYCACHAPDCQLPSGYVRSVFYEIHELCLCSFDYRMKVDM